MMLPIREIEELASARFREASLLFAAKEYDGAAYLCGYAVELTLKAKICANLHWQGYPESSKEFERLSSIRVHHLATLLDFTGLQEIVRTKYQVHWSNVKDWSPVGRYNRIGTVSADRARTMLAAAAFFVTRL